MSGLWQRIWKWREVEAVIQSNDPAARTEAIVSDLIARDRIPGLSVCVIHAGQTVLQKAWGYADLEHEISMHPSQTLVRAASASKPIAAVALGKLVASGKMKWDDSYYQYVPYFPKKKYDFSLRQLAGHTAGIRGYRGKEYAMNRALTIRDSLPVFQDDPLLFEPGTGYQYNSYDWVMLSLAMEEVTGMPFEQYVKKEILDPLGLTKTRPEIPDENQEDIAQFYTRRKGGFKKATPVDNRYKLAGGGYLTTAEELARFGYACLKGDVLQGDALKELWTSMEVDGTKTYYGLGWEVSEDMKGRPFYGHRGNSVGGYSNFYIFPKQELIFVALINCTDPEIQSELDSIQNVFLEYYAKPAS